jgi:Mob1/phocein family
MSGHPSSVFTRNITYTFFFSRLQIPVASHRHFSSLARRLGRIFPHAYFHHREAFEQAEAESSLYARFLALTERFELVPLFLVIQTDGHIVEGVGDSLGPPPSRSPRDEHRRSNEFDRCCHHHHYHHPNFPERNPSLRANPPPLHIELALDESERAL